jgi:hypothetical protein
VIVHGIDPGEHVGHALVMVDHKGPVLLNPPERISAETAAARVWRAADVIAIERPAKIHAGAWTGGAGKIAKTAEGLLRAAWIGGEIAGRARAAGATVIEVSAADARRALGVRIGGRRKSVPCAECSGSGADESALGASLRASTAKLLPAANKPGRGQKPARFALATIRGRAVRDCPCAACEGAGLEDPESVDQQVKRLLPLAVSGWPKVSNVHERDAAVVALYGYQLLKREGS